MYRLGEAVSGRRGAGRRERGEGRGQGYLRRVVVLNVEVGWANCYGDQ